MVKDSILLELLCHMMLKCTTLKSLSYAKAKAAQVIEMMKEFSKTQYKVDVLKVVSTSKHIIVEGMQQGRSPIHVMKLPPMVKEQASATDLPYYLS